MVSMFCTFRSAGLTNVGTNGHKLRHKPGIAGSQTGTHGAKIGAVAAKLDTLGHVMLLTVALMHGQASRQAAFAGLNAIEAELDVILGFHSFHNIDLT